MIFLWLLLPGSSKMYHYLRKDVGIRFYRADRTLDGDLQKIHAAIKSQTVDLVLQDIFREHTQNLSRTSVTARNGVYSRL